MLDALGGRKFLLSIIIIAVGAAVQIYSAKGLSPEFVALLLGVAGGFGLTNAFVSHSAMVNGAAADGEAVAEDPVQELPIIEAQRSMPPQAHPPVDLSPILGAMQELASQVQQQQASLETLRQGVTLAQNAAKAALSVRQS